MKKGLSLVEALVALVILLIGVMGFASTFSRSVYQSNAARNNSHAMFLASSFIEELRAQPYSDWSGKDIQALADQYSADFLGEANNDTFFKVEATNIRVGDDLEGYSKVTVTVNWLGSDGAKELSEAGFGLNGANAVVMEATIGNLTSSSPYGSSGSAAGGNS